MAYVIAEPCVDVMDRSCLAVCPVDCITADERRYRIQAEVCIDCGACVPVCPVEAIYHEDELPERWSSYAPAKPSDPPVWLTLTRVLRRRTR